MRQGEQKAGDDADSGRPHWYEYRTGFLGEAGSMLSRTLGAFAIGVVLSFVITFIPAFALNDGSVAGLLTDAGMNDDEIDAVGQTAEYLSRMSFGPFLILAFFGFGGVCLGYFLRDVAVSRSVLNASASGAPRTAVPTPQQVESISRIRFKHLWWFLFFAVPAAAVILVPMAFLTVSETPLLALAILILFTGIAIGYIRLYKHVQPDQGYRRLRIAEHWTPEDEQAAWDRVRDESERFESGEHTSAGALKQWTKDRRTRLGQSLIVFAICIGSLASVLLYIVFNVMYPQAHYVTNRVTKDPGPRADYAPWFDNIIGVTLAILATTYGVVFAAAIIGNVLEEAGRRAERRALRTIIDDPAAPRPPRAALAAYGLRHPAHLAQGLAMMAAVFIVCGTATVILGAVEYDVFPGAVETFHPYVLPATVAIVLGVLFFIAACAWNTIRSIRGRELRNKVIARWPAPPTRTEDIRGKEVPARVGPALTWSPDQVQ